MMTAQAFGDAILSNNGVEITGSGDENRCASEVSLCREVYELPVVIQVNHTPSIETMNGEARGQEIPDTRSTIDAPELGEAAVRDIIDTFNPTMMCSLFTNRQEAKTDK